MSCAKAAVFAFVSVAFASCACAQPPVVPGSVSTGTPMPVYSSTSPAPSNADAPEDWQTAEIEALQVAFAVGVSSRMPVGAADSFDASVNEVYFWNQLQVRHPPQRVHHIWYCDDKKIGESTVRVHYPLTRAWTRRRVHPGLWRVEIADDEGRTVMVGSFLVRPPAPR